LEKQPNILYKVLAFIAYSNIFISLCTASLAAYTLTFFSITVDVELVLITFGTTFLLYNTQQLLLGYLLVRKSPERKAWLEKNRVLLLLMALVAPAEAYPVLSSPMSFMFVYAVALFISLLYFLPFTNLRSIPFLKSLIVGTVWVLVCVVAPLAGTEPTDAKINFSLAQLFFITALCVLFNIRDMEQDKLTNTFTVPVLYGINAAKVFAVLLLLAYLGACYFTNAGFKHMTTALVTFLLGVYLSLRSSPKRHGFFYLYAVDGLIMVQSILGIVFLKA
jgi:4-hydroxybenzoate polyprenyltransferase